MIRISYILLLLIINIIIYNTIISIINIIISIYNIIKYINNNYKENNIGLMQNKEKEIDIKGYIIFLITEIIIFITFLSIYIYFSIKPNIELDSIWIPKGIERINEIYLPLFNTFLLLSSGLSLTISHLLEKSTLNYLIYTLNLVIIFIILQGFEYYSVSWDITSSLYSNLFFIITRFSWYTYVYCFYLNL